MAFLKKPLNNMQDNITPYKKIIYYAAELKIIEFTLNEIKAIINTIKNNKTTGEDNINSELIKLARKQLIADTHKLIYNEWTNPRPKTRPVQMSTDRNMAIIFYSIFTKKISRKLSRNLLFIYKL